MFFLQSSGLKLQFVVNQILSSVVSLELNADQVRYLVNRSPGKILSAVVPTFEAVSRNGNMLVVVQNNGTLTADYTLTVKSRKMVFRCQMSRWQHQITRVRIQSLRMIQ